MDGKIIIDSVVISVAKNILGWLKEQLIQQS